MANKKDTNKRRNKAAQKKQQQRKAKAAALRRQANVRVVSRPGISEMGAPEGFRAIGMSQAMMEYVKPLDEYWGKEPKNMDDLNKRMQLSMMLWNHARDIEEGESRHASVAEVVKALSDAFSMKKEDAEALRARMVARRGWLFPEDVQPEVRTSPVMIMRKEGRVEIKPFAYDHLRPARDEVPPDAADLKLMEHIRKLDRYMEDEAEYDEFEKHFTTTKELAEKRYRIWLADRGFPAEFHDLAGCVFNYFDFVYGYMHDDVVTLKTITVNYLTEYFEDFLIRKVYCDPQEYTDWPPAIKLFYLFLKDKGYMESTESIMSMLNVMELRLMNVLNKQFS